MDSAPGRQPPSDWPAGGQIDIRDVVMSYREGLPAVLHGVTLHIKPGERIGIVGRTGAGSASLPSSHFRRHASNLNWVETESSIAQALFRMAELTLGSIEIDGLDISKLGLRDLRERLAMIPQDPLLFNVCSLPPPPRV
jgi:ATP-binding cassette subfamily C (CFTR/MRP) protein 1